MIDLAKDRRWLGTKPSMTALCIKANCPRLRKCRAALMESMINAEFMAALGALETFSFDIAWEKLEALPMLPPT